MSADMIKVDSAVFVEAKTHLLSEYGGAFSNLNELDFVYVDDGSETMAYDYDTNQISVPRDMTEKYEMVINMAFFSIMVKAGLHKVPPIADNPIKWNIAAHLYIINQLKGIATFEYPENTIVGIKGVSDMRQFTSPVEIYQALAGDVIELLGESGEVMLFDSSDAEAWDDEDTPDVVKH